MLVTRAQEQARDFCQQLIEHGAAVVELPVIAIAEPEDWSGFDTAVRGSGDSTVTPYDWIVFASQNAVTATLQRLEALSCTTLFEHSKVASVGAATTKLLASRGIKVDFEPSTFVADSLAGELSQQFDLTGKRILLPRADIGREVLPELLIRAGAKVDSVVVYRTTLPQGDGDRLQHVSQQLRAGAIDYITVASSQSVRNLATLLKNDLTNQGVASPVSELAELMQKTRIIAIGPVTAETVRTELGREAFVARQHTAEGMLQAILTVLKFPKKAV